jgi:hypothetical protein
MRRFVLEEPPKHGLPSLLRIALRAPIHEKLLAEEARATPRRFLPSCRASPAPLPSLVLFPIHPFAFPLPFSFSFSFPSFSFSFSFPPFPLQASHLHAPYFLSISLQKSSP